MKEVLDRAAKAGRFGDDRLLHVSTAELKGLASLIPGGRLPTNPTTGLPEAFFFLPMLAGLGAAAAPAAAGALGAGMAAGMTAAGAAGLGSLGAATAAALPAAAMSAAAPAAAGLAGLGAAAAPTVAAAAAPTAAATGAASGLPILAGQVGQVGTFGAGATAMPSALTGATEIAASTPGLAGVSPLSTGVMTEVPMGLPSLGGAMPLTPSTTAAPAAAAGNPQLAAMGAPATQFPTAPAGAAGALTPEMAGGATGAAEAGGGLFGGGGLDQLMQLAPLAMMMPKGGGGDDDDDEADTSKATYGGGDPSFPQMSENLSTGSGPGYVPGTDAEYDYFPNENYRKFEGGGLVSLYNGGGEVKLMYPGEQGMVMPEGLQPAAVNMFESAQGGPAKFGLESLVAGGAANMGGLAPIIQAQHATYMGSPLADSMPARKAKYEQLQADNAKLLADLRKKKFAQGGMVQGETGLPSLGSVPQMPTQNGQPAMMPEMPPITETPFPKTQIGSPSEGDKQLIEATVAALKGQAPNAQQILLAFVNTFGEKALQDLAQRVKAMAPAVNDGMSDSIPAQINGSEPAALSEGEFVVPADVVSGLGNGSTDAGAKQLDGMLQRVRAFRQGGKVDQPPAMNAFSVMPA